MRKQTINLSWPATLSFSADNGNSNENFTRGKLKVFYQGETKDHRYFSETFSKEVIKSLPYTPIVSYYDEEKDDFVGHATEQSIYGIVDPCGQIAFEEDEEGKIWVVCDTVYYTERPDKVGEIAKKIDGHSQSLELDPNTVKYTVNYDSKRHFKNVEFTAGTFVGVSVLGKDQKPAFTGSEFFSCNVDFEEKMKKLKEYCEREKDQMNEGDETMNLYDFMKLSWGDISVKIAEQLKAEYSEEYYIEPVDFFNDCIIARFYSYIDGSIKLLKVRYSVSEDGTILLGDVNEVHVAYEDVLQESLTESTETGVEQAEEQKEEVSNAEETIIAEQVSEATEESSNENSTDAACDSDATDVAQVTNAEVTENVPEVSADNETKSQEDPSSASFAESERAEFENSQEEGTVVSSEPSIADAVEGTEVVSSDIALEPVQAELVVAPEPTSAVEESTGDRPFALKSPVEQHNARKSLDDLVKQYL